MVVVIGDIHGCFFTLKNLYSKIREKYSAIPVFSTGDLIDRGKYSLESVEFVFENKIQSILGNHELMFYSFFYEPESLAARSWMFNGSESTLKSYEQNMDIMRRHMKRLYEMPLFFYLEDCFISHAGISQKYKAKKIVNMDGNSEEFESFFKSDMLNDFGLLWNRDKLIDIQRLQIVGHTKQQEVRYDKKANTYYIDTGAYAGNKLSAVVVHNNQLVEILECQTDQRDIT
jgi:serine/threonine protein phosphatase 1